MTKFASVTVPLSFLFLSVYNSFILFFELKEFREDQMGKMNNSRESTFACFRGIRSFAHR